MSELTLNFIPAAVFMVIGIVLFTLARSARDPAWAIIGFLAWAFGVLLIVFGLAFHVYLV